MIRRVGEGDIIPWGYGFMWEDFGRCQSLLMVIPLNLIARWLHQLYFRFVIRPRPRVWELELRTAADKAFRAGYEAGYERGFKAGAHTGREEARSEIGNRFSRLWPRAS